MNVPKLRFKEFTDVWKEYPLKYFTTPIKRKNINNESDLPLTISSLDGLVDQRTYFNKVVASKDMSNYYLLKKGEFAYNKSYSVGFPFGSIKRLDKYNQGALSSLYICFQVNNMNSDFIVKYFESPQWHKQISLCVAEGARNHGLLNVNINDFFSTKHFLPQLAEQEKIANFLAIVDKKITNLENIITSLENQKKGLLQQIFSQKLRFKDKNGNNYPNWEKKKLGKLLSITSSKRVHEADWTTSGITFYRARDIVSIFNNKPISKIYISEKLYEECSSSCGKISENDLLVTGVGTIGIPYLVKKSDKFYFKDGNIIWLKNSPAIYGKYLFYIFISSYVQKQINMMTGKGTVGTYTIKNAKDTNILLSCLEEQTKIANFLSAFDRKLENQKAQLEHWKQIKKGLLQQMFV